ncbi:MAG: M16 family metallopeptidase [Candidatus Cyclobacteriaceae bacterium M3_2C_046]
MIDYKEFYLDNGLQVVVHEDPNSEIAVLNLLYKVGSRNENRDKTGFAHLFEHLMFGGSKNITQFDELLQKVGGESNAFTNPDITNYYITLPAINLETAFWLESDRMLSLSFDPQVLDVQKKVVIEEFKQRYLNQPYGDTWLKLRPLAYQKHPYQWPTIGKQISHIENATTEDVKDFFFQHYVPNNAVLVVAGNVKEDTVKELASKWFGPIPSGSYNGEELPGEPIQQEARKQHVEADVPLNALFKAYHMPGRLSSDYYATDLLSDVLGRSNSSRLYDHLVKETRLFNHINAYITGSVDPGLLVISGKLNKQVSFDQAEQEIQTILDQVKESLIDENELEKVKNQAESTLVFSEVEVLNRAMNLAYAAMLGDLSLINQESARIQAVNNYDIKRMANSIMRESNSSTLYYQSNTNGE